jgi:hypothetical protein
MRPVFGKCNAIPCQIDLVFYLSGGVKFVSLQNAESRFICRNGSSLWRGAMR